MLSLVRIIVLVGLAGAGFRSAAVETVKLVTYYNYTPWYFDAYPDRGLNAELARRLTELSDGRYRFESEYLPRKRVDFMIERGEKLVIAWVNPRFFADMDRSRYFWSEPLMEDESLIASSKRAPIEFDGPDSLRGKRFSAPVGHLFPDLDPLIAKGEIYREDSPSIKSSLQKVLLARNLDFAIVDRSTFNALKADETMDMSQYYVARKPRLASYSRQLMVTRNHPAMFQFISRAVARLNTEPDWINLAMYSKPLVFCTGYTDNVTRTLKEGNGALKELVKIAARRVKVNVELLTITWERCLAAIESGQVSGGFAASHSDEWARYAVFPMTGSRPDVSKRVDIVGAPPHEKPYFLIFGKHHYNKYPDDVEAFWTALASARNLSEYKSRFGGASTAKSNKARRLSNPRSHDPPPQ